MGRRKKVVVTEETAGLDLVEHFDDANCIFDDFLPPTTLVIMDDADFFEAMGFEPEVADA